VFTTLIDYWNQLKVKKHSQHLALQNATDFCALSDMAESQNDWALAVYYSIRADICYGLWDGPPDRSTYAAMKIFQSSYHKGSHPKATAKQIEDFKRYERKHYHSD
jgi:hypothetical protein